MNFRECYLWFDWKTNTWLWIKGLRWTREWGNLGRKNLRYFPEYSCVGNWPLIGNKSWHQNLKFQSDRLVINEIHWRIKGSYSTHESMVRKNQWLYILFVLYQGKRLIYNKETPQTVENRFLLCLFWVFAKIKSEASINISPFSFIITVSFSIQ